MMELSQTALFIGSIINLYALVVILRAWLQFARVDYYSPVSTFAVKMTDPILKPLRKIAPTVKKYRYFRITACIYYWYVKRYYLFWLISKCTLSIGRINCIEKHWFSYFLCAFLLGLF